MRLPVLAKRIAVLFETLKAILRSLRHRSKTMRYVSRYETSSAGWRDVAMIAVSSAYRANSTWREGKGMSLKYRLNRTGEIIPP
jgi:hypothetical protein